MDIRVEALIAAFVPSLVFLGIVYSRDRFEPEPKLLLAKLYAMSVLAVAAAAIVEEGVGVTLKGSASAIVVSTIGIGLIEEGAKFLVMVLGTRRSPHLNEPVDGMVYASSVALGFAAIETLTYIIRAYDLTLGQDVTPSQAAHLALVVVARPAPSPAISGTWPLPASSGMPMPVTVWATARAPRYLAPIWVRLLFTPPTTGSSLNAPVLAYTVLIGSLALYVGLFHRALAESPFRYHQLRLAPPRPPPPPVAALVPTDLVPPTGLAVWAQPNPSSHVVATLPAATPVQTLRRLGDWALVAVPAGWSGWLDGRALVPIGRRSSAPP